MTEDEAAAIAIQISAILENSNLTGYEISGVLSRIKFSKEMQDWKRITEGKE